MKVKGRLVNYGARVLTSSEERRCGPYRRGWTRDLHHSDGGTIKQGRERKAIIRETEHVAHGFGTQKYSNRSLVHGTGRGSKRYT